MHDITAQDIQHAVKVSGIEGFTGIYTELGGGEVNDTFLLDCGVGKVILRITRYMDVYNLNKEAYSLGMLDIDHIPKVIYFDEADKIRGHGWILETYVKGKTPSVLTTAQYKNLGSLLAQIHEVKHTEQKVFDLWADFLYAGKRFGDEERLMNHPDPRMRQLIQKAKVYITEQMKRFGHVQECLVHGDATLSNILVNGDEVGLIDWEFSRFRDPMSDFSTAFYEDMEFNKGKWRVHIKPEQKDALYYGYEQAGGVIDHDRIEMWMNHDKLGAAVYLWWLLNESGRDYPEDRLAQYRLDLNNLQNSLEKNLNSE